MSKKTRGKHQGLSDGRFYQMHEWFMRTPAWQATNVYERALYHEIKRRYNGHNNGDIPLSHREAEALLGCSNKPVAAAFAGLQDKGFIRAVTRGSFDWKVAKEGKAFGRSTRWEITEYPADMPSRCLGGGTKDFMKWKPTEKSAVRLEHTNGTPTAHHSEKMVRPEHTMSGGVYAHGTR